MFRKNPRQRQIARGSLQVLILVCDCLDLVCQDDVFVEVLFEETRHGKPEVVRIKISTRAVS